MNRVVLIGRLTKDPELRFTPTTGKAVSRITIAVRRKYIKQDKLEADFINTVVWGKQAEAVANYMHKGRLIGVCGRIETRNYESNGVKKYITEVIAEEVEFLDWGNKNNSSNGEDYQLIEDEDIPF